MKINVVMLLLFLVSVVCAQQNAGSSYGEEIPLDDFPVYQQGYRIQVGAFSSERVAVSLRDSLESELRQQVCLHYANHYWKVRLGAFTDKLEAERTIKRTLIPLGFSEARVVEDLIEQSPAIRNAEKIPGFRIQVKALSDRDEALACARRLDTMLPGLRAYVIFQNDIYKIQLGDFRSRSETERRLTTLKDSVNAEAWIVSTLVYKTPPLSPVVPPHTDPLNNLDD